MPRLPRVNYPNAVYHVTARGNGRATIFFEDADRHRFLRQLCDSLEADSVLLYAYVLMDNHFHLLARTYVARHYRIEPEGLKAHGKRAGVAKYVAVELACRLTGHSGRAVGAHYGGISSAAVSTIRRKLREGNDDLTSAVNHLATAIVQARPSKT